MMMIAMPRTTAIQYYDIDDKGKVELKMLMIKTAKLTMTFTP